MAHEVDLERKKLLKTTQKAERALLAADEAEEELYAKSLRRLEQAENALAIALNRVTARKLQLTLVEERLEQAKAARAAGPPGLMVRDAELVCETPAAINEDNE